MTLPQHDDAIKLAARSTRRPQPPRKRFTQILPDDGAATYPAAPVVQTRSLAEYERLLESAS